MLEVKKLGYDGCMATWPISKHASGNYSITLKSAGNHYLCGFPGHCGTGQKLKVTAFAKDSYAEPSTSLARAPSPASFVPSEGSNSGSTSSRSSSPSAALSKSSYATMTY